MVSIQIGTDINSRTDGSQSPCPESFQREATDDQLLSPDELRLSDRDHWITCTVAAVSKLATRSISGHADNVRFRLIRDDSNTEVGQMSISELDGRPFSRQDFASMTDILPMTVSVVCLEFPKHFIDIVFAGDPDTMQQNEFLTDQIIRSVAIVGQ